MATVKMSIFFLISISLFHYGHCLTCLTCEMTTQPRHCHTVTTCTTGEVCYTKRVQTHDLQIAYQLGCIDQQVCTENNMSDMHHKCEHCCSSDLCNAEACGETGYPSVRGQICYGCRARPESKPCGYIYFCDQEEVCSIVDDEEFGDVLTTTGCKNKHLCEAHIDGVLVGKRTSQHNIGTNISTFDDPLSIANCRRCCSHDLCNLQCQQTQDIVSYWSKWSDWNVCSPTCGHNNGTQQRTRVCEESGITVSSEKCLGVNLDMRACSIPHCAGNWLYWSSWTTCCPSCGITTGTQERHRDCNNTLHYGSCVGTASETQQCLIPKCEGEWFNWSSWTTCSPACGTNITQHRTRACNNTVYQYPCVGTTRETRQCSTKVCLDQLHNCKEILDAGLSTGDGLYNITVDDNGQTEVIEVSCDMTTDNGGWTIFQYRYDGSVDFYKTYSEYSEGFGSYPGEFWLGLKWLHAMTAHGNNTLRVDLASVHNVTGFALYSNFSIGPASSSYMLHVAGYVQNATIPDRLNYHNDMGFSTRDHDVDTATTSTFNHDCAKYFHGAFWYKSCYNTNLNGPYLTPGVESSDGTNFNWYAWPNGALQSLLSSKLSFKPF